VKHRPTVYDVAERAGVSIATVSFAFRQPERVRDSTRAAVEAAARELGYVPSANARGLARGKTGTLGMFSFDLILDDPYHPHRAVEVPEMGVDFNPRLFPLYIDEVQRGFENECHRSKRVLLLGSGPGSSDNLTDIAGRVDGLAILPTNTPLEDYEYISQRIPIVAFGMPDDAQFMHHIRIDNQAGMRAIVEHLYQVHNITEMAIIGHDETYDFQQRIIGFNETLRELGLTVPAEPLDATRIDETHPLRRLRAAIRSGTLPQALVCASDQDALTVLDLLAESGVSVPQDVAVTGFDGIMAGLLSKPPLTTVLQPMSAMGRLAVQILNRQIKEPSAEPEIHVLPVQLVVRESCGC